MGIIPSERLGPGALGRGLGQAEVGLRESTILMPHIISPWIMTIIGGRTIVVRTIAGSRTCMAGKSTAGVIITGRTIPGNSAVRSKESVSVWLLGALPEYSGGQWLGVARVRMLGPVTVSTETSDLPESLGPSLALQTGARCSGVAPRLPDSSWINRPVLVLECSVPSEGVYCLPALGMLFAPL